MNKTIIDNFGRVHNYLRISLTDRCNLRCFYCMPEWKHTFAAHQKLMQAGEIEALARIFVENGVNKIRLTGGEPLVRKDAPHILRILSDLPVELTMTTNAVRIDEMLPEIIAANFGSINISLDTLRAERFMKMTRRDYFERVRSNMDKLLDNGIPTKINMVVMKGMNDDEIPDFVELTKDSPIEVRFIEFMPFSGNRWTSNQVVPYTEILNSIKELYPIVPAEQKANSTTKPFSIPGHAGRIAFITTMTSPFCGDCNRMRLTADGKLKNCLFSKGETDLLSVLRQGGDVLPLIHQCISSKSQALGGQLTANFKNIDAGTLRNRSMIRIGG